MTIPQASIITEILPMLSDDFTLFFATDLHGSNICFRKFVNAAQFYHVDALFLGGDLAAKSVVPLWQDSHGSWNTVNKIGQNVVISESQAQDHRQNAQNSGQYITSLPPDELQRLNTAEKDAVFRALAIERLQSWLSHAETKLATNHIPIFAVPGNDDPFEFNEIFSQFPFVEYLDARSIEIAPSLWVVGLGGSTLTPWKTYREMTEDEIRRKLIRAVSEVPPEASAIYHVHVPPYGVGLDAAPLLNRELRVQMGPGGMKTAPVGSIAVREIIEARQPSLGLFGHVHEARGTARLGRSFCVNPGSQYSTGALLGFWARITSGKMVDWRLTQG